MQKWDDLKNKNIIPIDKPHKLIIKNSILAEFPSPKAENVRIANFNQLSPIFYRPKKLISENFQTKTKMVSTTQYFPDIQENSVSLPRDPKYFYNKLKLASILSETNSILDDSIEHKNEIERIKNKKKSKYLTGILAINMLKDIEYKSKWKSALKSNKTTIDITNSNIKNIKKVTFLKGLSHIPKISTSGDNVVTELKISNDLITNKNFTKTNTTTFPPNNKEKEINSKTNSLFYPCRKNILKDKEKSNIKIKMENDSTIFDYRIPKVKQINITEKMDENELNNFFEMFNDKMKKHLPSYLEYASKIGKANDAFDYLINVNNGTAVKQDIQRSFAGMLTPGNLIQIGNQPKKFRMINPRYIKTKFKKYISVNEFVKDSRIKKLK